MQFGTECLPKFKKRKKYYDGKQAITTKPVTDEKPSNIVVTNYIENIVSNFEGYALGIPVKYESDSPDFGKLQDVLNYNDKADADAELFRLGLIYGRSAEIAYVDRYGKTRFKALSPEGIIPVYSDDLEEELLYCIRFWSIIVGDETKYKVEVYDANNITYYDSTSMFSSITFVDQQPHYFSQVPVTIFSLNTEEKSIGENVFSLQDAYNSLLSDGLDDSEAFADAYLVLSGITAGAEELASMKQNRVLMIDNDASASYLVKDSSQAITESLMKTVEEKIRTLSACPDFTDESFGTSSGIAIRYKMLQMENVTSAILNNFKKALQKRIELLSEVEKLKSGENVWRDIKIIFTRNLPVDISDTLDLINTTRGLVSDETLLGQLEFIDSPAEELAKAKNENDSKLSVMRFGNEITE